MIHSLSKTEDFIKNDYNYEVLQDGLWKSARYGLNGKIIDPFDSKVLSLKSMIKKMLNYCEESLKYFNNKHVIKYADDIIKFGSESEIQLKIYRKDGFSSLNKYLMESVEYNY